jgi:hypothetical protein
MTRELYVRDMRAAGTSRSLKGGDMNCFRVLSIMTLALMGSVGCSDSDDGSPDSGGSSAVTVLDLDDVKADPDKYEWFDFRPNVLKLILAGAAETEHIAILWYTVEDGAVGLHYHSKTESVYVIDGTQTDGKGLYPTGTVYFNPPGSGHEISDSSGFFLLAYAAPPDFMATDQIEEYTPVRIDTEDEELTSEYPFEVTQPDVQTFAVPLEEEGGMTAEFIETSSTDDYTFTGNYVLVLEGTCEVDGTSYGENMLVVTKDVEPTPFVVAAPPDESCLALGVSF